MFCPETFNGFPENLPLIVGCSTSTCSLYMLYVERDEPTALEGGIRSSVREEVSNEG